MRIQCKCGNAMSVDSVQHAGKKVACPQCGQRYRIPPKPAGGPVAPDRPDAPPVSAAQAGLVALGEKTSYGWVFISMLLTLVITVGGGYGAKLGMRQLMSSQDLQQYLTYAVFAAMWAPCLAFVTAGWITARFSPGRTIVEPAVGSVLTVAVLFFLAALKPGPVAQLLGSYDLKFNQGTALKVNLFVLAMFIAAMLACAGAYFGEVSQSRSNVLSGKK